MSNLLFMVSRFRNIPSDLFQKTLQEILRDTFKEKLYISYESDKWWEVEPTTAIINTNLEFVGVSFSKKSNRVYGHKPSGVPSIVGLEKPS